MPRQGPESKVTALKIRYALPVALAAVVLAACGNSEHVDAKSADYPALTQEFSMHEGPLRLDFVVEHGMRVELATDDHPSVTKTSDGLRCSDAAESIQIIGGNPQSTGQFGTRTVSDGSFDILFGTPNRGERMIVNGTRQGRIPTEAEGAEFAFLLPKDWGGKISSATICRLK